MAAILLSLNRKRCDRIFLTILIAYFVCFSYYNVYYLRCYWAAFYKAASFLLLCYFESCEYDCGLCERFFYPEITDTILSVFSFSVALSLLANIIGIDAIFLDVNAFHIRSAKSGVFSDERLTWVFMHKSSYGLLLVLALSLLIKRKDFRFRRLWICIYFIAGLRINSMVSIISMCGVLFAYYIETNNINRKTVIKLIVIFLVGLAWAVAAYYFVAMKRDLSSLGQRAYIWAIYADTLAKYPHGMGRRFFSDSFWLAAGVRYINNFHNVFLNELIHYSVPVGALYSICIFYYPIKYIVNNDGKIKNVVLLSSVVMPMLFDQALNDLIFPISLILLKLCFSNVNKDVGRYSDLQLGHNDLV